MPKSAQKKSDPLRVRIEYFKTAELVPYAKNARKHSAEQVAQLAGVIREFGFVVPVVIDGDKGLKAGHGRVLAAQLLGMPEVPAVQLTHLSEKQWRAFVLADNQIALNAKWDDDLLRVELADLRLEAFDLSLLGFPAKELEDRLGTNAGLVDENIVPEPPKRAVSRVGDIWQLGKHELACGDCTKAGVVERLLRGRIPALMCTDPPYGVSYDPLWRHEAGINKNRDRQGKVKNDDRADWKEAWDLFPGDVVHVWHGGLHSATVQRSLEAAGFEMRAQIVWVKDRFALSRGHYHWRHEPAWYAVRRGKTARWRGGRKQDTTWRIEGLLDKALAARVLEQVKKTGTQDTVWEIPLTVDDGSTSHGTQKPVECMRRPMRNSTAPDGLVYEPFCGSGSSLIAAETIGRSCLAVELDPLYVDVAVLRWQAFTGLRATLQGEGLAFELVAKQRK